ncbi:MAG: hypothetical protein U0271_14920 [Polyangiaceae bacterium]
MRQQASTSATAHAASSAASALAGLRFRAKRAGVRSSGARALGAEELAGAAALADELPTALSLMLGAADADIAVTALPTSSLGAGV